MTFDSVLPALFQLCEGHGVSARIERFVAVRDVRGRVRLVVEPRQGEQVDSVALGDLQAQLTSHLGEYFVEPILNTRDGRRDLQRLAVSLIAMASQAGAQWPRAWPIEFSDVLGVARPLLDPGKRWLGIDRTVGKDAWLGAKTEPPWQLRGASNPPIITFHSFKGGVGRTTLLLAHAVVLASRGKRVAVVDLDLEAPGLGTLVNAKSRRGVVDLLVDHLATGHTDLHDAIVPCGLPKPYGERISVVCAGNLGAPYLEKLARLDFATEHQGEASPVVRALESLLKVLRSHGQQGGSNGYDAIIVDARAGLHDISGVAVHSLAHASVLVLRGTEQHLQGLEMTLETLAARRRGRPVLVESMLPVRDAESQEWRTRTQERVYALACDHWYEDSPPQLEDPDAVHWLMRVRRKDWLDSLDSFSQVTDEVVRDKELVAVSQRIDEACRLEGWNPDRNAPDEDGD